MHKYFLFYTLKWIEIPRLRMSLLKYFEMGKKVENILKNQSRVKLCVRDRLKKMRITPLLLRRSAILKNAIASAILGHTPVPVLKNRWCLNFIDE